MVIILLPAAILTALCRIDPVINLTEKHMTATETVNAEAISKSENQCEWAKNRINEVEEMKGERK